MINVNVGQQDKIYSIPVHGLESIEQVRKGIGGPHVDYDVRLPLKRPNADETTISGSIQWNLDELCFHETTLRVFPQRPLSVVRCLLSFYHLSLLSQGTIGESRHAGYQRSAWGFEDENVDSRLRSVYERVEASLS